MAICTVRSCEVRIARGRVLCDRHKAMATPDAFAKLMEKITVGKELPRFKEVRRGNKLVVEVDDG